MSLSMEDKEDTQDDIPDEQGILNEAITRVQRLQCKMAEIKQKKSRALGEAIDERPMPPELAKAMEEHTITNATGTSKAIASRALAQLEKTYTQRPKKQTAIREFFKSRSNNR